MGKLWTTLILFPALCLGVEWQENELTLNNFLRMKFEMSRTSFGMLVNDTSTALQVTVRGDNWHRSKQCFFGVAHIGEWISLEVKRGGSIEESSFGREDWSLSCLRLVLPESTTVMFLSSGGPSSIRIKTSQYSLINGSVLDYLGRFKRLSLNTTGWRVITKLDNADIAIMVAVVASNWTRIKQCNFDEEEVQHWQTLEIMKRGHALEESSFGKLGWSRRCFNLDLPESSTAMYLFNGGPGKIRYTVENAAGNQTFESSAVAATSSTPTPTDAPQSTAVALMALLVACCICLLFFGVLAFVCWMYKKKNRRVGATEAGRTECTQQGSRDYPPTYPYLEMNHERVRFTNDQGQRTTACTNQPRTGGTAPPSCNTDALKREVSGCNGYRHTQEEREGAEAVQDSSEHIYEEWNQFNQEINKSSR